jgi:hypothetical protein
MRVLPHCNLTRGGDGIRAARSGAARDRFRDGEGRWSAMKT